MEVPSAGGRHDDGQAAAGSVAYVFEHNRKAVIESCPWLRHLIPAELPEGVYAVARDGSLSVRVADPTDVGDDDGESVGIGPDWSVIETAWLGGTSVPRRAAECALSRVDVSVPAAVLIAPIHPQVTRVLLDKLACDQMLLLILPEDESLAHHLTLVDFSEDLSRGRLRICAGLRWREQLGELLDSPIDLPIPTRFVRVGSTPSDVSDRIQSLAQPIIAHAAERLAGRLSSITMSERQPVVPAGNVLLLGSSRFVLWNDASARLWETDARSMGTKVDLAHPIERSPSQLARRAEDADLVVSADFARAEHPGFLPATVPWICLAQTRVPRVTADERSRDLVFVMNPELLPAAVAAWGERRAIDVRTILEQANQESEPKRSSDGPTVLLMDRFPDVVPEAIERFSTHRLLWDHLERAVAAGDRAMSLGVVDWLKREARRFNIDPDMLPLELLLSRRVIPLLARATAKRLVDDRAGFEIWGEGWQDDAELSHVWRGPIGDVQTFDRVVGTSGRLVDVWAGLKHHPVRTMNREIFDAWTGTTNRSKENARPRVTRELIQRITDSANQLNQRIICVATET